MLADVYGIRRQPVRGTPPFMPAGSLSGDPVDDAQAPPVEPDNYDAIQQGDQPAPLRQAPPPLEAPRQGPPELMPPVRPPEPPESGADPRGLQRRAIELAQQGAPMHPKHGALRTIGEGVLNAFVGPGATAVTDPGYYEQKRQYQHDLAATTQAAGLQRQLSADELNELYKQQMIEASRANAEARAAAPELRRQAELRQQKQQEIEAFNAEEAMRQKGATVYQDQYPLLDSGEKPPQVPGVAMPPPLEAPANVTGPHPLTGKRYQVPLLPRPGMIGIAPEVAKELGLAVGRPLGDGTVEVSKTAYDSAIKPVTEKENEQVWIATLNDPKSTPEQKKVARANLDESAKQKKAGSAGTNVYASIGGTATDAQDIAQAIIDGKRPPVLTGLYRMGAPVSAHLARAGYDQSTALRDWDAIRRFMSTMNGPQQLRLQQAVKFAADSMPIVEQLYEDWKREGSVSGVKVFNRASLIASKNLPGKAGAAAQALETQLNDLTSELGTVYKGGNSSTDESLKLAKSNLDAEWNDETFKRAVQLIKQNLQIRKNSILTSQPIGVSEASPYRPEMEGEGDEGTGTVAPPLRRPFKAGLKAGAMPTIRTKAERDALPVGTKYIDPDGNVGVKR